MHCRHCETKLSHVFCDLQTCPPSNAMLSEHEMLGAETYFPLSTMVCTKCWLVQVDEFEKASNIFNEEYTYFSSYSSSWLEHSKTYAYEMVKRLELNEESLVVEIASNDGYLLQY